MKKIIISMILALSLLLGVMPALAVSGPVNIDFDSLPAGTFTEHQEDGFLIQYIGFGDLPTISDVGGNHVLKDSAYNAYGAEVRITSLDGANFYFNSLDYNNFNNNYGGHCISILAYPYPYDGSNYKKIELSPTSSAFSTLTSTQLGVDGIELCLLRVNCVSMNADYSVDNINLTPITPVKEVVIDIKPGSLENPVNPGENGQIPVAILGSSSFDVTQIDASSIRLGSATLSTRGKAEKLAYSFEDVNGDGFMDMITFFGVPNLALTSSETGLTLTAVLNSGTPIIGSDNITIVPGYPQ